MMSLIKISAPVVLSALALTGCVSMSAVPANEAFTAETAFSVQPSSAWSRLPNGLNPTRGSALTQDGVPLGAIYMVTAEDDKPMIDKLGGSSNPPRFTKGSTAIEQVDFLTASLGQIGFENLVTANVRPETVDGANGTRLSLTGTYANGLDMRGDAILVESDEGLNVLVYAAPKMHYFDKYEAEAMTVFKSIDLK